MGREKPEADTDYCHVWQEPKQIEIVGFEPVIGDLLLNRIAVVRNLLNGGFLQKSGHVVRCSSLKAQLKQGCGLRSLLASLSTAKAFYPFDRLTRRALK